nr:hypothetical protein [Tanacetum cinerariifolium]
ICEPCWSEEVEWKDRADMRLFRYNVTALLHVKSRGVSLSIEGRDGLEDVKKVSTPYIKGPFHRKNCPGHNSDWSWPKLVMILEINTLKPRFYQNCSACGRKVMDEILVAKCREHGPQPTPATGLMT